MQPRNRDLHTTHTVPRLRHKLPNPADDRRLHPTHPPRLRRLLRRRRAPTAAEAADWARSATGALDGMTATQHLLAGIVAELPQPSTSTSTSVTRPETCRATANVMASLVREGARGGGLMQNGVSFSSFLLSLRLSVDVFRKLTGDLGIL